MNLCSEFACTCNFFSSLQTIDLEQQAKRHMEEAMRLSLEEKDDKIKVLEEKVSTEK